jgi:hypothetical protein
VQHLLPIEVCYPFGPNRVLDVFVAEPRVQRPGVVAGVRQGVAAAMPQHMRHESKTARASYLSQLAFS